MKTCLIRQPAGIGDIIFLLKVGCYYAENDHKVTWPILDHFMFIKDYLTNITINFVPMSSDFEFKELFAGNQVIDNDDVVYLPLQDSSHVFEGPIMESKYKMANVTSHESWLDSFNFKRNLDKEKELYYDVLGLTDDSEYVFTNRVYASLPHQLELDTPFETKNDYPEVKLRIVEGFTPFDWCMVFEKAKEIHTVGTSICFIMEHLNITEDLYYYKRPQEDEFNFNIEKSMFKQPWNFIC